MTIWDRLWIVWLANIMQVAVFFIVLEWRSHRFHETLSENVWGLHLPAAVFCLGGGLLVGLIVWLTGHFASGGRWGI